MSEIEKAGILQTALTIEKGIPHSAFLLGLNYCLISFVHFLSDKGNCTLSNNWSARRFSAYQVHKATGRKWDAFKAPIPTAGRIRCLKNNSAPSVVNSKVKVCNSSPVGNSKAIIFAIFIRSKCIGYKVAILKIGRYPDKNT